MSNITINDLPVEVLAKILGYLDPQSKGHSALVCKRWQNVADELVFWPLKIDFLRRTIDTMRVFPLETRRKFNQLFILSSIDRSHIQEDDKLQMAYSIIQQHGAKVVSLNLYNCFWNYITLVRVIECMPDMRQLYVFRTKFINLYEEQANFLQGLRILEIIESLGNWDPAENDRYVRS